MKYGTIVDQLKHLKPGIYNVCKRLLVNVMKNMCRCFWKGVIKGGLDC